MAKSQELLSILKGSYIKFKNASAAGPFNEIYLAYSQYSGDAAHPTFTALMRHYTFEDKTLTFDVEPNQNDHQLDETLNLACISLLGVAVVVNEMCGYTQAGKFLPDINNRFRALQAERFGTQQISPGLEIRTERR